MCKRRRKGVRFFISKINLQLRDGGEAYEEHSESDPARTECARVRVRKRSFFSSLYVLLDDDGEETRRITASKWNRLIEKKGLDRRGSFGERPQRERPTFRVCGFLTKEVGDRAARCYRVGGYNTSSYALPLSGVKPVDIEWSCSCKPATAFHVN